jgi:ABC-type transporter Mla MlaB component
MKKLFAIFASAVMVCGVNSNALAQVDAGLVAKFLDTAKAASDSQLGVIASELTGKVQSLGTLLGANDAIKGMLDNTLKSLTGGKDSAALAHAFDLVKAAKLTPDQIGLAKQVGNLASAYVVQKNFATLEGSQSDVATLVSSLREGKLTAAIAPVKNIAGNTHLTDGQKTLIKTVADKYAPGWQKAKGAVDAIKKLPGF